MATFAVMSENEVTNIIVADNKEQSEQDLGVTLIEFTQENPAAIGWTYDSATGTFTAPVVE
jgi:hypothetical protein